MPCRSRGRQAQGRPLGLLVAWLLCGANMSKDQHGELRRRKQAVIDDEQDPISYDMRVAARTMLETDLAWAAWCTEHGVHERAARTDEGHEPLGLA